MRILKVFFPQKSCLVLEAHKLTVGETDSGQFMEIEAINEEGTVISEHIIKCSEIERIEITQK